MGVRGRGHALAVVAATAITVVITAGLTACASGVTIDVDDLAVGQCTIDADESDVTTVTVVPCSGPHNDEVFALVRYTGASWPGIDAMDTAAERLCSGPEFEAYVGVTAARTKLDITWWRPSESTWADGDREIICRPEQRSGAPFTGSLRGAAV
ncbi:septum formation family protein [Pseudonocardia sp. TRM90224]|uniref:septum formation family protein n=1 Tax=Pseudonocardia sp. TRM90224 TaxID=2812678 RepID=UPI001E5BD6A1|nr:septum formation family protein [Pseudonocardia sp. TRM90224]